MLKTILSVSGKPGLYKMVSQGKNLLIVESLIDKKRIPTYARDKVISLGDIAIYTNDSEVPLHEVLNSIKKKEDGKKTAAELSKATPEDLRAYLAEILPDFDRERVYPTDIKRLISWYNILLDAGITDFEPEETEPENTNEATDAPADNDTAKKTTKAKTSTAKRTAAPKKTASAKQPVAKTTTRTRQKQG